jgi:hypothetical protein
MKNLPVLFFLCLFIGISCKKDTVETLTRSEMLTQKTWVHDNQMVDFNNNLKPDDDPGIQNDIRFNFYADGTLDYTKDQTVKQLHWTFENDETVIRITGIMDDSIIPPVEESVHEVYQLDENMLVLFYPSTLNQPEFGTFEIFKHN